MFVVDTNIVSELRKARTGKANGGVIEWAEKTPVPLMFLSVISLHELEHGVLLTERRDPTQGELLRTWLESNVKPAFDDRLLPVTTDIAVLAASLHVPDPAPFRDALIAATALNHSMTVATRNVRDFQRFPNLNVINPWS